MNENMKMYTSKELAEMFGVTQAAVTRWKNSGKITVDGTTPSGRALYSSKQVEALKAKYYGTDNYPTT